MSDLSERTHMEKNKRQSNHSVALTLALTLILIVVILAKLQVDSAPFAVVKGNSMLPLLREGDLVILVHASPQDIEVGDIIVYKVSRGGSMYIIHRVIDVKVIGNKYYYRTAGDNNKLTYRVPIDKLSNYIDNPLVRVVKVSGNWAIIERYFEDQRYYDTPYGISYERIIGKVAEFRGIPLKIPYLGYLSILLKG